MARLREEATVKLCYTPVYLIEAKKEKILFHNARSLHSHFKDISPDRNFAYADVVAFAESRLKTNDVDEDYTLQGFTAIRNDQVIDASIVGRPYHGLLTLINQKHPIFDITNFSSVSLEFTYIKTGSMSNPIQLVFLYRSGAFAFEMFKSLLATELSPLLECTMPLLIIGDFNIDATENRTDALDRFMHCTFNCTNKSHGPTTDYGSTIDLVFTNIENTTTTTFECPWSDHKAILVCIDECEYL